MEISNKKLSTDAFFAERKEVLGHWHNGKGVDFDEAVAYPRYIPREKRFGLKMAQAAEQNVTLIQPRAEWRFMRNILNCSGFLSLKAKPTCCPPPWIATHA